MRKPTRAISERESKVSLRGRRRGRGVCVSIHMDMRGRYVALTFVMPVIAAAYVFGWCHIIIYLRLLGSCFCIIRPLSSYINLAQSVVMWQRLICISDLLMKAIGCAWLFLVGWVEGTVNKTDLHWMTAGMVLQQGTHWRRSMMQIRWKLFEIDELGRLYHAQHAKHLPFTIFPFQLSSILNCFCSLWYIYSHLITDLHHIVSCLEASWLLINVFSSVVMLHWLIVSQMFGLSDLMVCRAPWIMRFSSCGKIVLVFQAGCF